MESSPSLPADLVRVRRALLSVSEKSGLVELGQTLVQAGVELISTGGTARALADAGLPVTPVDTVTGFPEMLDGRVKTLHPKIHGGILGRRDLQSHQNAMAEHGIQGIDLVVVNLYPFEETAAKSDVTPDELVEQIDIGGPSMVRSAAKNHRDVVILTDPSQYAEFIQELTEHNGTTFSSRRQWAGQAFAQTARYDAAIADQFAQGLLSEGSSKDNVEDASTPKMLSLNYPRLTSLRYGENPSQNAAVYINSHWKGPSIAHTVPRHGKPLSYNNLLDAEAALMLAMEFDKPAVAVIKHNNPCGAAESDRLADAFVNAYAGDPLSAFGSVIAFNRPIDDATAGHLVEPGRFVEVIIAPQFDQAAFEKLTTVPTWKNSVRLLEIGALDQLKTQLPNHWIIRSITGGALVQSPDVGPSGWQDAKVVTKREPTAQQRADLGFAWLACKHVRSNAIVLAKNQALIGVGAGQMSRVDSVRISIEKAGDRVGGAALASDAFFPFRDNVDLAAKAGITAIVQPGGSKRDQESIDACDELGLCMLFTGQRHFKH